MSSIIDKVEILVSLITRAFYPDDCIVVMDFLLREKFALKSEIGARLKMKVRTAEGVLSQLLSDRLIFSQLYEGKEYIYVDYLFFVHYIRLRIHLMLDKTESASNDRFHKVQAYFECPNCSKKYDILEATMARNTIAAGNAPLFLCKVCCPFEPAIDPNPHPRYILKSVKNKDFSVSSKLTKEKITSQLQTKVLCSSGGSGGTSILDLLKQLENEKLSRNFPSDNIRVGHEATYIEDEQRKQQLAYTRSLEESKADKKRQFEEHEKELKKDKTGIQKLKQFDEEQERRRRELQRENPRVRAKKDDQLIHLDDLGDRIPAAAAFLLPVREEPESAPSAMIVQGNLSTVAEGSEERQNTEAHGFINLGVGGDEDAGLQQQQGEGGDKTATVDINDDEWAD